jgi:transketolase
VLLVYTHDSIGLGEDGPTHQPIEHLASLRLIPNMSVWRPCDAVESAMAWKLAIERKSGPTALIFSRQNLPHQPRSDEQLKQIVRGGYVLSEAANGKPEAILIATGSEVGIAIEAQKLLAAKGKQVRVVSMPATDVFDAQDAAYRESVLPRAVTKRVAVEAAATGLWYKYVGSDGRVVGLDRFGASAPGGTLYKHFGFTADNVAKIVEEIL